MEKIAIVFDFDNTLTEDSTSKYLREQKIDPLDFWENSVQNLINQKWDITVAYMYGLIEEHKKNQNFLSITSLKEFSKKLSFFPGVEQFFGHIKNYVGEQSEHFEIEFYIISSGIGTIVGNCNIIHEFKDIWASNFVFNEEGHPFFVKNIVSFTDKTRYLFQIQKELVGPLFKTQPFAVNEKTEKKKIPFTNMIFIGDGWTDVPCFAIMQKFGGTALCVYDPENKNLTENASKLFREKRVIGSAPNDYSQGSLLYGMITQSIQRIIKRKRV